VKSAEFKFDKLIARLRWPVAIFGVVYFVCMIAAPWINGGWHWNYVQDVWDRWQGVNVGILAFGASFIAFEVTRYKENRQRNREFLAARAFLPEALSEISGYLEASAAVYMAAWNNAPQIGVPSAPVRYKDVFANCIRHADAATGERLSEILPEILTWLQIHSARLGEFIANPAHTAAMNRINALDGLRLVGEIQATVNKLFGFARGQEQPDPRPLVWEEYKTAYSNLGLHIEQLFVGEFSLEGKTKRHIEKSAGEVTPSGVPAQ
jgi:hypothetical protein